MNPRTEFVLRAIGTDNFRTLCQEYGISTKTGYKWKERFMEEGLKGMGERSRRPKGRPDGLAEAVVCEMIRLKQAHRLWGPRKIRQLYARVHGADTPSESSFKRVLARAGLVEERRQRRREQSGRLNSGRRAQVANEVGTVDFKGWWHGVNGQRCEPLTVRDEFSRDVLEMRSLTDARTETVRACFERIFGRHGLLGLTRLSAWWLALGIDLERSRPGCPQDNGGHERLHLDMARELEAARPGEEQATLDEWRRIFNEERPHEALAMRCPSEVYVRSTRGYEAMVDLDYGKMRTRRVHNNGCIRWEDQSIFISGALCKWSVGLEPMPEGLWRVWFGRLALGQIDPQRASFQSAQVVTLKPSEAPGTLPKPK